MYSSCPCDRDPTSLTCAEDVCATCYWKDKYSKYEIYDIESFIEDIRQEKRKQYKGENERIQNAAERHSIDRE